MATTDVHASDRLLRDGVAVERGSTRSDPVVESCNDTRRWPEGFFATDRLTAEELAELREAASELDAAVRSRRRGLVGVRLKR